MGKLETDLKIALVGCGAMGSALLKGWLQSTQGGDFWVISPQSNKVEPFLSDSRVTWFSSPNQLPHTPDILIFAVKPSLLEEILPLYRSFKTLIISVAAGKPLAFYETYFPECPIVRAMPNLLVSVHIGTMGLFANTLGLKQKEKIEKLFERLAACFWLTDDEEMDKMTAISGSGPAYVFYFIEAFIDAAEALGFDSQTAKTIAFHTFSGANLMATASSLSPAALRQHVTSPNGTTAAALKILEDGGVKRLMIEAAQAAFERAKELRS